MPRLTYDVIVIARNASGDLLDSVVVRNVATLEEAKSRATARWARELPDLVTALNGGDAELEADFTVIIDA